MFIVYPDINPPIHIQISGLVWTISYMVKVMATQNNLWQAIHPCVMDDSVYRGSQMLPCVYQTHTRV